MSIEAAMLRDFPLFRALTDADLAELAALAAPARLPSGALVFDLGDVAERFYIVVRGAVNLTMPIQLLGSTQDAFVDEIRSGILFGWSALVEPHRYTMAARAAVDSEVLVWRAEQVLAYLARSPATGYALMSNLASRVSQRLHRVQAMWLREVQRAVTAKHG